MIPSLIPSPIEVESSLGLPALSAAQCNNFAKVPRGAAAGNPLICNNSRPSASDLGRSESIAVKSAASRACSSVDAIWTWHCTHYRWVAGVCASACLKPAHDSSCVCRRLEQQETAQRHASPRGPAGSAPAHQLHLPAVQRPGHARHGVLQPAAGRRGELPMYWSTYSLITHSASKT